MRILVTGAAGLLGREITGAAWERGWDVLGLARRELDVTDPLAVEAALRGFRPRAVIHCAAYTHVDRAEAEPDRARAVNVDGVRTTAEAAHETGATFVSFSTDFVFDGRRDTPYLPGDPTNPLNVYGATKLEGERAAADWGAEHLTVRTSWLYGAGGRNFVTSILRRAAAGEPLQVVMDQRGRPTWARELAHDTLDLLDRGARDTWHVAGGGTCTWLELAREAVRLRGLDVAVQGVSAEAWGAPAERPRFSVLDVSATEAFLERPMRPWRDALRAFVEELDA